MLTVIKIDLHRRPWYICRRQCEFTSLTLTWCTPLF